MKDELYLGVFLRTFGDYSTINSSVIKAEIRLMSEDVDPYTYTIEHSYTKSNETIGTPRFIRYSDLFDSKLGFVIDDMIELQCFMVGIQTRQAKLSDILDREFDKRKRQEEEKMAYEAANETFEEMRRISFADKPLRGILKKPKETENVKKRATSTNYGATSSRAPFREVKQENENNRYPIRDAGSLLGELKANLKKFEEDMAARNKKY